jgi:U3 small nucleolar RNA-associated protein 7
LERLKVSGKAADGDPAEGDVEMGADGSEEDKDGASGGEEDVKEKEKMKMRGKGKSLKR